MALFMLGLTLLVMNLRCRDTAGDDRGPAVNIGRMIFESNKRMVVEGFMGG